MSGATLMQGDCLDKLKELDDNSVDSIVTDPPYGLGFMGKKWDALPPSLEVFKECLRVLKPGGHLLAFGGSRTYHRMAVAVEDAGFEIRDMVAWVYGSGFPKSQNVSKAIDKASGARGHDSVRFNVAGKSSGLGVIQRKELRSDHPDYVKPVGITEAAKQWDGWGTALKPSHEPIVMARKPLTGTVAANVMEHGTGAINIDGCRVGTSDKLGGGHSTSGQQMTGGWKRPWMSDPKAVAENAERSRQSVAKSEEMGRWPANLIHDGSDEVVGLFPEAKSRPNNYGATREAGSSIPTAKNAPGNYKSGAVYKDTESSAARFFYCPKASKKDRNEGLTQDQANNHPTVKPTDLMRYLCRLVTPPGGTVLDPFMGSGSTGKAARLEGFGFVGIELDEESIQIAEKRIAAVGNTLQDFME